MGRSTAAIAAGVAALAGTVAADCLEKYQCIFHHDINGVEYSWDLHSLCMPPGQEYMATNFAGQNFTFNVCGNATNALCSWDPDIAQYDSTGVAVQFFGPARPVDPDNPTPCTNWDNGQPMACTGQCEVVGTAYFQFTLINPNDPNGGVLIQHDAMPPAETDAFKCPELPSGLLLERRWNLIIGCDGNVNGLVLDPSANRDVVVEFPQCTYTMYTKSSAACGVKGDPYSYQTFGPGTNFGFTVLGAVLVVFLQVTYHVGDNRGWWDPVKNRLPAVPGFGGGGYKSYAKSSFGSGVGGGSSSYGAGSTATPIAASAYGTA